MRYAISVSGIDGALLGSKTSNGHIIVDGCADLWTPFSGGTPCNQSISNTITAHRNRENDFAHKYCIVRGLHTFPQSLVVLPEADAIFDFFLEALSDSPALTTMLSSFLHRGQYLENCEMLCHHLYSFDNNHAQDFIFNLNAPTIN